MLAKSHRAANRLFVTSISITGRATRSTRKAIRAGRTRGAGSLSALENLDFAQIIPGHGTVLPKSNLAFFRSYMADLIAAVRKAAGEGASLEEMQKKISDDLAPKYEKGMSKYPIGQYRDRVGVNVEMVLKKVVKKA